MALINPAEIWVPTDCRTDQRHADEVGRAGSAAMMPQRSCSQHLRVGRGASEVLVRGYRDRWAAWTNGPDTRRGVPRPTSGPGVTPTHPVGDVSRTAWAVQPSREDQSQKAGGGSYRARRELGSFSVAHREFPDRRP